MPEPPPLTMQPDAPAAPQRGSFQPLLLFAFFMALAAIATSLVDLHEPTYDPFTAATFAPTLVVSAIALARESVKRPYSLHQMHLMFVFLAFSVIPLLQYLTWTMPWTAGGAAIDIDRSDYTLTNAIVGLWLASYLFFYYAGRRAKGTATGLPALFDRTVTRTGLVFSLVVSVGALTLLGNSGTFLAFTRAAGRRVRVLEAQTANEVVTIYSMAVPLVTLAAVLLMMRRAPKGRKMRYGFTALALAIAIALLDNPLAFSRFWTGTAFIGLFVAAQLHRMRRAPWFMPAALFGILLGMPFLNQARNVEEVEAYTTQPIGEVQDVARGGDYDSFTTFFYLRRYIDDPSHITWGRQLLGAFLFFVPRKMWPEKPIGSGAHMARFYGFHFTNLLAPSLPAEGIINFWWFGVPLFAWVFARLARTLDDSYEDRRLDDGPVTMLDVIYCFYLGLVLFVSRGDLMTGTTYITALTVAALPLWVLSGPRVARAAA